MSANDLHPLVRSLQASMKPWSFEVDGLMLRGWHTPPTGKPVIHFIHGNGFSALTYAPFLTPLLAHYDLFLVHAQGHGESDAAGAFRGWNANAEYCLAVWQTLGQPWKHVKKIAVGHSFGGVLSSLMVGCRENPFDQLVMLDPVLFSRSMIGAMAFADFVGYGSINKLSELTLKRRTQWPNRVSVVESLRGKGMFAHWSTEALACYASDATREESDGSVRLKCPPVIEAGIFGSYPRQLWSSIHRINMPVTMLYGKKTYPFVRRAAIKLRKIHPHSTIQSCPGGHCFMLEDSPAAIQATLAALAE